MVAGNLAGCIRRPSRLVAGTAQRVCDRRQGSLGVTEAVERPRARERSHELRLRVAQFPSRSAINPALELFGRALQDQGVEVVEHSVLPGDPDGFSDWVERHSTDLDVLHLHWFQRLYLRSSRAATVRALARMTATLRAARREGVVVTWTSHNVRPHERRYPELDDLAAKMVVHTIDRIFVECPEVVDDLVRALRVSVTRCQVVPSGSYASLYQERYDITTARRLLGLPEEGRLFVAFGLIRRYKRVPELIRAFRRAFDGSKHTLLVAGEPHGRTEYLRLLDATGDTRNVILRLRRVAEAEVPAVVAAANHVVCNYRDMHNSGIVLLAASLARGSVVPRVGTVKNLPAEAVTPVPEGTGGLISALTEAVHVDWRQQGLCAKRWADRRTWPATAAAATAAWSEVLAAGKSTGKMVR